jgi:glycine/D-amino acid oxidase-like deaminating enzyme
MTHASGTRTAVIGGGALGLSTAVHLARRGGDVVLVTQGRLGDGASGRSLAWLNSFGVRSAAYHRLRMLGLQRYRALAASLPATPESPAPLRFGGGLKWARAGESGALRDAYEHMQSIGYRSEWLTPEQIPSRCPGVDARAVPVEGAVFAPDEGWVDLLPLLREFARELVALGGTLHVDVGPAEVVAEGDRVVAVAFRDETIEVGRAVLATGAEVPTAAGKLGVSLPDATTLSLLVRTRAVTTALSAVLNTPRVAVRPTSDGALVLDSGWSEREVRARGDGTYEVHDDTVSGLLNEASAVLEGNPSLTLESYAVGPKPIPSDGEPVLGKLEGVAGCFVAFTHSGATLALIAGELLADEIMSGEASELLAAFRPRRFMQR